MGVKFRGSLGLIVFFCGGRRRRRRRRRGGEKVRTGGILTMPVIDCRRRIDGLLHMLSGAAICRTAHLCIMSFS